jgi:tRNA-Thr(GGU) m(6)t(6)A37 methyltransferase TsaA
VNLELVPIGYVRSPYRERGDAPRQGRLSDIVSEIVIDEKYLAGLDDLEHRPRLIVLSWFDRADRSVLRATPPGDSRDRGVFSIRSPDRPNPVAISVVDLLGRENNLLRVRGLDALDGTPVIDIKPYIPEIDRPAGGSGPHGTP